MRCDAMQKDNCKEEEVDRSENKKNSSKKLCPSFDSGITSKANKVQSEWVCAVSEDAFGLEKDYS